MPDEFVFPPHPEPPVRPAEGPPPTPIAPPAPGARRPRYAHTDPSAAFPRPVLGWYDTEEFDYPNLHEIGLLTEVPDAVWARRLVLVQALGAEGFQDAPAAPEEPPAKRVIQTLPFRRRFTQTEIGGVTLAAHIGMNSGDPTLQVGLDTLTSAAIVWLDDPLVVGFVDALVAYGLIEADRKAALLATATPAEITDIG